MDYLQLRFSMAEVRQAPAYDHVVWSASYQTTGSLRRHSEKDFDIITMLETQQPRAKSAAPSKLRRPTAYAGSLSPRSISRQSYVSDKSIHSASTDRQKRTLHKGLSSPALLAMPPISARGGDTHHGYVDTNQPAVKFKTLRRANTCIFEATKKSNPRKKRSLRSGKFTFKDSQKTKNESSNVINGPFLPATQISSDHSGSKPMSANELVNHGNLSQNNMHRINDHRKHRVLQLSALGRHGTKNTHRNYVKTERIRTPGGFVSKLASKEMAKSDTQSTAPDINIVLDSSSSDCSSDVENFFYDSGDDVGDDCFPHLTWDSPENDKDSVGSEEEASGTGTSRRSRRKQRRKRRSRSSSILADGKAEAGGESRSQYSTPRRTISRCNSCSSIGSGTANTSCPTNGSRDSLSKKVSIAPEADFRVSRREMQRRFSSETWYQKALKALKDMPVYAPKTKENYSADPEEVAKRLCRPTASSRAREAATTRVIKIEPDSEEKSARTTKKSVMIVFVHVEDWMKFKGQKHVTSSEMQSIVKRLSECNPKQVPEAQRILPRENLNRVGIMNTAAWRGENPFQKEMLNIINVETQIQQLRRT